MKIHENSVDSEIHSVIKQMADPMKAEESLHHNMAMNGGAFSNGGQETDMQRLPERMAKVNKNLGK